MILGSSCLAWLYISCHSSRIMKYSILAAIWHESYTFVTWLWFFIILFCIMVVIGDGTSNPHHKSWKGIYLQCFNTVLRLCLVLSSNEFYQQCTRTWTFLGFVTPDFHTDIAITTAWFLTRKCLKIYIIRKLYHCLLLILIIVSALANKYPNYDVISAEMNIRHKLCNGNRESIFYIDTCIMRHACNVSNIISGNSWHYQYSFYQNGVFFQ